MAVPADNTGAERPRPGADLPIARAIALLVILLPIVAWFVVGNFVKVGPSPGGSDVANLDPRTMLFADTTTHFLPTPVAALPAVANVGPPAPAADEHTAGSTPSERVKIANTGGVGAILRAEPPKGRVVAALRDGTVLQVLEHRKVDDGADWLRVRTPDGAEGWVFSRLVATSD
jgi:hypothetical protein